MKKAPKWIGIISIIAGVVMFIAGAGAWGVTSAQLKAENITVPGDSDFLAGAPVAGPFSAFAQAETIKKHTMKISDGKTYAELGKLATEAKDAGDTELAAKLTETRATTMTSASLRASLFTSILAFGVAALVMGVGVLHALSGWAIMALAGRKTDDGVVSAEAAASSGSKDKESSTGSSTAE
ncbi:MAG: hypothetical protein Q4G30_10365 [Actinomycetaceae bacterium]|nr:hypothetical protein [Actinomycetaceae bacterium]